MHEREGEPKNIRENLRGDLKTLGASSVSVQFAWGVGLLLMCVLPFGKSKNKDHWIK